MNLMLLYLAAILKYVSKFEFNGSLSLKNSWANLLNLAFNNIEIALFFS